MTNNIYKSTKELFNQIDIHLINDNKPSIYIKNTNDDLFYKQHPFIMISNLKNVKQSKIHHPEGDVFTHTMLVVDEAAKCKNKSSNIRAFMWAALLHDIGKSVTTKIKKGRITSYDHDIAGEKMAITFLSCFIDDETFIKEVAYLVRYHMQILFVTNNLPFADILGMKQHTNVNDVALLALCDRLGRLNVNKKEEQQNVNIFLKKVNDYK